MSAAFLQDFGPETVLLVGAAAALIIDRRGSRVPGRGPQGRARTGRRWPPSGTVVALAAVLLAFGLSIGFWHSSFGPRFPDVERGAFIIDRYALFFHALLLLTAGAVLLVTNDAADELAPHRGVHAALVLVATCGAMVAVATTDLLTMVTGLAATVLPLCLALGLRKLNAAAATAAVRAFVGSAVGLLLVLGGVVLLLGLSGSTRLGALAVRVHHLNPGVALAAVALVLGLGLCLVAGPALLWGEDAAADAPLAALLPMAVLAPLTALAVLMRVVVSGLGAVAAAWSGLAAAVAALLLLGSALLALRQARLRRLVLLLLAGQFGLALAALPALHRDGPAAALYLLLTTAPLAVASLGLLPSVERAGGDRIEDLRGLWGRAPLLCAGLAVALVALAGGPPLAPFFARLFVLTSAMGAGAGWLTWLAALAAAISGLAVLRWLLVLFDPTIEGEDLPLPGWPVAVGLVLCAAAVILGGVLSGPLMGLAARGALPLLGG